MIGASHIVPNASAWVDGIAVGLATDPRNGRSCAPRFNGESVHARQIVSSGPRWKWQAYG